MPLGDDFDSWDLGIALALRDNGFDEQAIVTVLGYLPDMTVTAEELDAYEARLDRETRSP